MTRRHAASLLVSVLLTAAVALVWRPWDPVADEVRSAARAIANLPGVVDVDVEHRGTTRSSVHPDERSTSVALTVRLDAGLEPEAAAEAAFRVRGLHDDVEQVTAPGLLWTTFTSVTLDITAGEPVDGVAPLEVPWSAGSTPADVASAVTILHAGAAQVGVYAGGDGSPRQVARVVVRDVEDLVPFAELTGELGLVADLETTDGAARYEANGNASDRAAVRLLAAASEHPAVESAILSEAVPHPSLDIHGTAAPRSPQVRELARWLEAPGRTTGRPVAYAVTGPGYAAAADGWVGDVTPPEPEPHPLPVPDDVVPWSDDADAPSCSGADLDVTYGGADAATGARFAALRARNVSGRPCAVEGVPEISFRNGDGIPQEDVTISAYEPGAVPARVVVPPDGSVLAPLGWRAMSTAGDADVTAHLVVVPVPTAGRVLLDVTTHESSRGGLDVLDGADVRLGPWVQALEGWSS